MTSEDIATRLAHVAEAFAAEHGLDLSLASLDAFERAVKAERARRSEGTLFRWAAYLGETMRRASGGAMRWADEETLESGTTRWFPKNKVAKFLDHGEEDSPAAFAKVALAFSQPTTAHRDPFPPAGVSSVASFFAAPSDQTLLALASARGRLLAEELVSLLREHDARPSHFYPFLSAPAKGRGWARKDPGRTAARHVWLLVDSGLADPAATVTELSAMLGERDKALRSNAAYALGRVLLGSADDEAFAEQYERGDAVVRLGALSALLSLARDRKAGRHTGLTEDIERDDVRRHAKVLSSALRGSAPLRTVGLQSLRQFRADITPILDPLLEVLDGGKPAHIECGLQILTDHAFAIKHGRAPFDGRVGQALDAIVRHSRALPGKAKVTKVQIAARYALQAYQSIEGALDEGQRSALHEAFEKVSHIR